MAGPRTAWDAWGAVGALAGWELALCRLTGGPPAAADLAAEAVVVVLAAVCFRWGRALGKLAVGVGWALGIMVPVLAGRGDWVAPSTLLTAAAAIWVFAPVLRGHRARSLDARGLLWLALSAAVIGLLVLASAEGQRPPTWLLAGLLAVTGVAMALGRWGGVVGAVAVVPAASPANPWPDRGPPGGGPDVVLITIDTLRLDAARTMSSLALVGPVLEAQAAAPWTLPSLATVHTGLEPHRHGALRRTHTTTGLDPGVRTLAERLGDAGWDTAATAENPYAGPAFGLDRGFHRFHHDSGHPWGLPRELAGATSRPLGAALAASVGLLPGQPTGVHRRLADARELLAERRDRPLFLWVHVLDPHLPYTHASTAPGLSWRARVWLATTNRTAVGEKPDPATLAVLRVGYDHEVGVVDGALHQFLQELGQQPAPHGRLVVVTSDHGEGFGEHDGWEHGHNLYQELLAVPLVLGGASWIGAAQGVPGHVDVTPTVLAAAGLPWAGLDGRDLATTPGDVVRSVNLLYGPADARAVRVGPAKLIDPADGSAQRTYDLAADPGEQHPILDPGSALAPLLPPPPGQGGSAPALDPATRARLEALGYLAP